MRRGWGEAGSPGREGMSGPDGHIGTAEQLLRDFWKDVDEWS
jgi:hypothetical protein